MKRIYETLKVGDHVKCNSIDEAMHLITILENDGFKCSNEGVDVFVYAERNDEDGLE